jgi:hypothetical protein
MSEYEETQTNPPKDENVSISAGSDGREAVYVRHPVSPEMKKLINKKGFRIITADFAPDHAVIYSGTTGKPEGEEEVIAEQDDQSADKPKPRAKKA